MSQEYFYTGTEPDSIHISQFRRVHCVDLVFIDMQT